MIIIWNVGHPSPSCSRVQCDTKELDDIAERRHCLCPISMLIINVVVYSRWTLVTNITAFASATWEKLAVFQVSASDVPVFDAHIEIDIKVASASRRTASNSEHLRMAATAWPTDKVYTENGNGPSRLPGGTPRHTRSYNWWRLRMCQRWCTASGQRQKIADR